jgi:hypothetical protein
MRHVKFIVIRRDASQTEAHFLLPNAINVDDAGEQFAQCGCLTTIPGVEICYSESMKEHPLFCTGTFDYSKPYEVITYT